MESLFSLFKKRHILFYIYLANLFLSFHYFSTAYINSSFLSNFLGKSDISLIYIIASIANLILLFSISDFLKKFGNYRLLLATSLVDLLAVFGLAVLKSPQFLLPCFFLHQALVPVILFCLDVFLENNAPEKKYTGEIRGLFLTVTNAALVISPLIVAIMVDNGDFSKIYLFASACIIPIIIIAANKFKNFEDPAYRAVNLKYAFEKFFFDKNLFSVLSANLLLQFFYAFMVIYSPIYLNQVIGFSWQEIGLLFTLMLLPFVLFEFPIGAIADKKIGEKEIMTVGFIITGLATSTIAFTDSHSFIFWATILFLSRVGASFVETTTESYFFKHTKGGDADLMGLFRGMRPFAYIIAPLMASSLLVILPFKLIFLAIGIIVFFGSVITLFITDTK